MHTNVRRYVQNPLFTKITIDGSSNALAPCSRSSTNFCPKPEISQATETSGWSPGITFTHPHPPFHITHTSNFSPTLSSMLVHLHAHTQPLSDTNCRQHTLTLTPHEGRSTPYRWSNFFGNLTRSPTWPVSMFRLSCLSNMLNYYICNMYC